MITERGKRESRAADRGRESERNEKSKRMKWSRNNMDV